MPTIDADLQRKAQRRELAKSRRKGDFITCDGGPVLAGQFVSDVCHSVAPQRSAAEIEAERKAKADREWADRCWRLYS
jgi:hypothetical protein